MSTDTRRMGFNVQAEDARTLGQGYPIVAIPHIDWAGWKAPYDGLDVYVWRLDLAPNNDKHKELSPTARVQLWNEDDEIRKGGWTWQQTHDSRHAAVARVRQDMPGQTIIYGGPRVVEDLYGWDQELIDKCDMIGAHVTTFEDFGTWSWQDKRWCVLEIGADPDHPETWPQLYDCAVRALAFVPPHGPRCEIAMLWGVSLTGADAVQNVGGTDFRSLVKAYNINNQGDTIVIDPNDPLYIAIMERLNTKDTQVAAQTEGLRRVTEGHYNGIGGSAAIVDQLEGGGTQITPQPDYVPNP